MLIDKPAPPSSRCAAVAGIGVTGLRYAGAVEGEVTVVNVFASWCIPCRDEHPLLEALKQQTGVRLFGINQKDAPENAVAFLTELGNPYDAIGADANGRASIDWGVYGVPETFVVNADGRHHLQAYRPDQRWRSLEAEVIPAIEKAKGG